MDLTIEDLRCELEKRGLDPEGEIQELRSRFEQALEDENEQDESSETIEMDSSKENLETEDTATDKKEEEEDKEMVTIKEGKEEDKEEAMVTNEEEKEVDKEEEEKEKEADDSEVQSLPSSAEDKTVTDEKKKDPVDPTPGDDDTPVVTPQEKTTENNDKEAVTKEDKNSKAETKDSTKNPPASKGEENESFEVLVDDTQNDLDADIPEKAKQKSAAAASKASPPVKTKEGGGGDKAVNDKEVKTEKKAEEKKEDKDGKLKSSTTTPKAKPAKNASSPTETKGSCNLWISGLSSTTKATQLKGIFAKYGKVVSAKVVTNAKNPGAKCFCFLTMGTVEEAAKCIQHLNQTKINNQTVTIKSSGQKDNDQNKSSPKINQKEKPELKETSTVKKEVKEEETKVTIKEGKKEETKVTIKEVKKEVKEEVKEEAMVTNEEEKDVDTKEEEKEKEADDSEVQSLPSSAEDKTVKDEKKEDSVDPTPGDDDTPAATPQEKTTENKDKEAVTTEEDKTSKAETKDTTENPPGAKGEENESLIVLVDDTQNDLDADLPEKAKGKSGAAASKAAPADGAKTKEGGVNAEVKTEKKADEKKDDKDGKLKPTTPGGKVTKNAAGGPNSCNLWISGLSSTTKATHVKGIFSKYGKVIIAKLVTNARNPGSKCFCFLTMSSAEEATRCIQRLNNTKINRQTVTVKSAKTTPGLMPLKKPGIVKPGVKAPVKADPTKTVAKSPAKKPLEKKLPEKKPEGTSANKKPGDKPLDKKPVPKPGDKRPLEKKPETKIEAKKDGKPLPDKGEGGNPKKIARSSLDRDRGKMMSPSKNRTPSKTSSHSPRRNERPRHPRSRDHSSEIMDRDFKMTLELKQRKTYLEREVRRQERQIDHARLVELELQRRQKEEAYRLDRVREELRMEREKLERERVKLERAEQSQIWKERQQADMYNGFERERERHAVKRPYERKPSHNENFWDEQPKRPNVEGGRGGGGGGGGSSSTSRFNRSFNDETWFSEHKESYDRRGGGSGGGGGGGDSYYNSRESKPMESVSRFSDSNAGRMNHSPQRAGHERYGQAESSSRLSEHVASDNRFERRDVSSVSYHGHETDHRNLSADRGREIDRRNVSAHERLGRIRNQPVGGSTWKSDSYSHGGMDTGHQWVSSSSNNMNQSYERGNTAGGSGGFVSGGGSSSSALAQNAGMGNMYGGNSMAQQSNMMAGSGGGGSSNMGSRMQEPRFDAYKNMEHSGMRRY